jgi:hypothetical protein
LIVCLSGIAIDHNAWEIISIRSAPTSILFLIVNRST